MDFKKKTLIWETNTEPPKNYIWIKEDGKAYEYNNVIKKWIESNIISVGISDKQKIQSVEDYLGTTLEDYFGITLEPEIDEKYYQYFTIEATQNETKVYFRQSSYAADEGLDPLKVEVSTDNGATWTKVTAATAKNNVPGAVLAELDEGDRVLIRGKNDAYGFYSSNEDDAIENCDFWTDNPCYVYGNIMSLIGGDDFARLRKVNKYAFSNFFSDYDGNLDWSWVLSKQGEELLLPATTLTDYCYYSMFLHCTSLTSAPELPATILANNCYCSMFWDCTNLTTAPALPATTLATHCYSSMFDGCTSLTKAPELRATTLAECCYMQMFQDCTSITNAPQLPATTLAERCYCYMFGDCTGLTTAPELPATTLAEYCYNSMFSGCTSLTKAPQLPATTLANYCYDAMFSQCTSLTKAPELPATALTNYCYASMFNDCTSLTQAPELPATTLAQKCYYYMFYGCTNLNYIKAMFTTIPEASYTSDWVNGVAANGTFVKNASATWTTTGVNGIPIGWTVETANA